VEIILSLNKKKNLSCFKLHEYFIYTKQAYLPEIITIHSVSIINSICLVFIAQ